MFITLLRSKRTARPPSQHLHQKRFRPALETLEDRRLLSGAGSATAALSAYGQLPLSFEDNQGQTSADVRFLSRGNGYALFLTDNEAVLSLQSAGSRPAGHPHALTPPTR